MTSNPTIFQKAIAETKLYDADIQRLAGKGSSAAEIFEGLAVQDVQGAADVFRPVYEATQGTTASSRSRFDPSSPATRRARSRRRGVSGPGALARTSW